MKMKRIATRAACLEYIRVCIAAISIYFAASLQASAASPSKTSPTPPSPVAEGKNGWLFLESELRFLSFPVFWGKPALQTARSPKPEAADPLPAIVDFSRQLAGRGISLFVVPVPPKAWNSPHVPSRALEGRSSDSLGKFYKQLAAEGVKIVDLRAAFKEQEAAGEQMYCKTDSHWSGAGCVVAAVTIAKALAAAGVAVSPSPLPVRWTQARIRGDLLDLKQAPPGEVELLQIREIGDAPLQPNPSSNLLLLGDSHTLVFHDFLADGAGLPDQLAKETGITPDWIGTRGSGANAVRVSLLRRALKEPAYLESKKAIVWCFAAREFTESEQGWQRLPLTVEKSDK